MLVGTRIEECPAREAVAASRRSIRSRIAAMRRENDRHPVALPAAGEHPPAAEDGHWNVGGCEVRLVGNHRPPDGLISPQRWLRNVWAVSLRAIAAGM